MSSTWEPQNWNQLPPCQSGTFILPSSLPEVPFQPFQHVFQRKAESRAKPPPPDGNHRPNRPVFP
eukprot:5106523-Pyramimonas_sp.AAC.1